MDEPLLGYEIVKITILGSHKVGKTSIIERLIRDLFFDDLPPTFCADFTNRMINFPGSLVKLQLWDTAGLERFRRAGQEYRGPKVGFMVVYDCTDPSSFHDCGSWFGEIERRAENRPMMLVGNKCDLSANRAISEKEGRDMALVFGASFMETSAKDSTKCGMRNRISHT